MISNKTLVSPGGLQFLDELGVLVNRTLPNVQFCILAKDTL
jgi:hypothetical protein